MKHDRNSTFWINFLYRFPYLPCSVKNKLLVFYQKNWQDVLILNNIIICVDIALMFSSFLAHILTSYKRYVINNELLDARFILTKKISERSIRNSFQKSNEDILVVRSRISFAKKRSLQHSYNSIIIISDCLRIM